jgi:diguanylate cyclase (GGDEF)-like protein
MIVTSPLLGAQRDLVDCALQRKGFDAVLDQALVWACKLLSPASCALVVVGDNGTTFSKASTDFPPALLPDPTQFTATGGGFASLARRKVLSSTRLDTQKEAAGDIACMEVDGQSVLMSELILLDGDRAAGALLVHSDQGPLTEAEDFTISALAGSIGLAMKVTQNERNLRSADEKLASLTAAIPGVVYQRVVKPDGQIRYIYISESAYDLFGVTAAEILANPKALFDHYSPDYREHFQARLLEASRTLSTWDVEASIMMADGQQKFTHAIARPALQDDGSVVWTGIIMDATRIKKTEAAVAAAEANTRHAIIESLSQGFLMYDAQDRLTVCNSHYWTLYPKLARVVKAGMSYRDVATAEAAHAIDPETGEMGCNSVHALRLASHSNDRHVFERQLNDDQWILVNEHREADGGTIVLYTDISDLKLREKRMNHIAHHDALTDLPNRILFREKLEEALKRSARTGEKVAVFCLDLDHFKNINDTLGHPAGDSLLKVVAKRLMGCLRSTDTAARLGGDEFAIIVTDLPTPDFASGLAARLLQAVIQPVFIEGNQVLTAASIGIALSDPENQDPDRLIKSADMALYRAKSDGRNTYRYFEVEMDVKAHARRTMELDLRTAIARDEMELHYQPVVDIDSNEIVAFEALIRWTHPIRGKVPPLDFIGFAEETGLIRALGEWILRRACNTAATWSVPVRVAVNLSPAQFKDRRLADTILQIVRESGLAPNRLELEITESLLLSDTDANLATLHRLKAAGIRISMDDFGTGYSSLGNLRSFPFDKIKIDQSFIKDLETNPDSAAIVRAVLSLGNSLGIGTIAEGVETSEQMLRLKYEGCTQIQGFYYSKAQPAAGVAALLDEHLRDPKKQISTILDEATGELVPPGEGDAFTECNTKPKP